MTTKKLPKAKISAITYIKSFGESIVESYTGPRPPRPPPITFPPPSWELEDKTYKTSPKPSVELPTEPSVTFAKRIGALIDSLPTLPSTITASFTSSSSHAPPIQDEGKQGSPVPPELDEDLIRMLGSEEIMNGQSTNDKKSNQKGKNTPQQTRNIWNILASLKSNDIASETPSPNAVEEEDGGVMMYAPLEPTEDSKLELAESVLEYVDDPLPQASPESDKKIEGSKDASISPTLPNPARKSKEKHKWVPSTTDLSVLATWWGYRLYLPPPVMNKLGGLSLKASARAVMITTALKWFLDKIPLMLIPVQFRPAVKMLKMLSPIVGYVGVFIAWSWDRIKSLDEGNGVVLTATWLLPVALLPMSWDAGDIYGPRLAPQQEKDAPPSDDINNTDDKNATKSSNNGKLEGKQKQAKKKSIFSW